jgi:hypothetical protein
MLLESEQVREPRLHEPPLLDVEQVLGQRRIQFLPSPVRLLVLGHPTAHPHHVRERPVGNAFAVGEAAASVPPDVLDDPVEVLVELPREPGLSDPGDPGDRDQMRPPVVRGRVEEFLDQLQLPLATDERRLQTDRFECARSTGHDPQSPEERDGLRLPLQLV